MLLTVILSRVFSDSIITTINKTEERRTKEKSQSNSELNKQNRLTIISLKENAQKITQFLSTEIKVKGKVFVGPKVFPNQLRFSSFLKQRLSENNQKHLFFTHWHKVWVKHIFELTIFEWFYQLYRLYRFFYLYLDFILYLSIFLVFAQVLLNFVVFLWVFFVWLHNFNEIILNS